MDIIRHPIKPEKGRAWHAKGHPYFTKQSYNVVKAYIEHYSRPGDTVLDPFAGTGVTAIEAVTLKRKVITLDINPLANFLIRQTCAQVNIGAFTAAFQKLESSVKNQIEIFDKMTDNVAEKQQFEYWYPQNVKLPRNSDFNTVEELFTRQQLLAFSMLLDAIQKIKDHDIRDLMKYVFSATLAKVNLTYMPSERGGKTVGGGGPSIFGKYRYWRPKEPRALPVWSNFESRFRIILKGKKVWNDLTKDINLDEYVKIIDGSALELTKHVNENSIDYIYTDPPYGGNIAYLDLSTMWNSWLQLPVTQKMRKQEIIEGGDLDKTQEEYSDLLAKSMSEMARVLKKNAWLSCVFAHKKLEFWNIIVDSCEANGLAFKGSVFQPTNNTSIHWKKNRANVLCSQRIANFQKTKQIARRPRPDNLKQFILNEIERQCKQDNGASLDEIYQRVVERLLQTNSFGEAKKKGYLKIESVLLDETLFHFDAQSGLYYVKDKTLISERSRVDIGPNHDELKTILRELFLKNRSLTIDKIHKELFAIFEEDKRFPIIKDLEILLPKIAYKNPRTGKWQSIANLGEQQEMKLTSVLSKRLIRIKSDGHSHSEMIFRLVKIGEYLGYVSWIGKREQSTSSFMGFKFKSMSLPHIPLKNLTPIQKEKIEQIDVIWFDALGFPRYAFEVEESTSIDSGIDRFKYILQVHSDIARHLFIVAPRSRRRKIEKVFGDGPNIGHPLFMENKVYFIFKETLVSFYDSHVSADFKESDLKVIFEAVDLN